jgi:transcriptional regulator with XRE-family HTH domain
MRDLTQVLAVRVRKLRNDRGWNQEELAFRAGISSRYVGYIERCEGSATVAVLGRLADALGVNPCDLITSDARKGTERRLRR